MLKSLNGLTLKDKKQYLGKHFVCFTGYAEQASVSQVCNTTLTL